jgi:creatinine amidohydrolase/Fe(II)-dependent formamide hydrolase-like protein
MNKSTLFALVAVSAWVAGERKEFAPGDTIPEEAIPPHDIEQLKRMGAIADEDEIRADEEKAQKLMKAGVERFQKEREAVQRADASIVPDGAGEGAATKPAGTKPAKKS